MPSTGDTTNIQQGAAPLAPSKPETPGSTGFAKLRLHVANIYRLFLKELSSIRSDPIVLAVIAYTFTISVYAVATGASTEAKNLSIGIVDEDHSDLSRRIADGFTRPTFQPAVQISAAEIDAAMNSQRFIFIVEIPPRFQSDILSGRQPTVQIDIDATAVAQAFNGKTYIQNVILNYVAESMTGREGSGDFVKKIVTRIWFNPNSNSSWFSSVMSVLSQITLLTVVLTGAALIRESEQGTVDHLLVMPVIPVEIMLSKVLANGIVILLAAELSMIFVVRWWLQVPIAGSALLFLFGSIIYMLAVAALGIALATLTSTMAQFGLLVGPVLLILMLLSGATTPMESMPVWLQYLMSAISPMPHFVVFAQDTLFRGAGLPIVRPQLLAMAALASIYFGYALYRFRHAMANA